MKGLYKLAIAFEKASQVPAGGYFNHAKPSDPAIMALQTQLINLKFPLPHGADGIMGPETQSAINAFKAKNKIPNASPDIVSARIQAEADKLLAPEKSNQVAFAVPGPLDSAANPTSTAKPAKQNTSDLIKDLNGPDPSSGYVGPNQFVNTVK